MLAVQADLAVAAAEVRHQFSLSIRFFALSPVVQAAAEVRRMSQDPEEPVVNTRPAH
jgi:hypothetical protein